MVDIIGKLGPHKNFGNWFDGRTVSQPDNSNTDHKALRDWARSKEHNPAFHKEVANAKEHATKVHHQKMKMENSSLKEHEHPYWNNKK